MKIKIERVSDKEHWASMKTEFWSIYVIFSDEQSGLLDEMLKETDLGSFDGCPNNEGDNDELEGDHISVERFLTHDTKAQWEKV